MARANCLQLVPRLGGVGGPLVSQPESNPRKGRAYFWTPYSSRTYLARSDFPGEGKGQVWLGVEK